MAKFRTLEEISLAMLDFLRIIQPDLDTKPGTVARDLFIDLPANEIAKLYLELRNISNLQSLTSATGSELDRLARNYGIPRNSGSRATGTVVFTTNSLDSDILVPRGTIVVARNGITFSTQADLFMDSTKSSVYRSNAIRMQTDLNLAGIDDTYAAEVAVEATSTGVAGRIGKYSIVSQPVGGISNVTNIQSFSGGSAIESDDQFRARILSVFSGGNIGTSLGYENAVLADSRVVDAVVVGPGDPLMTRDGSQIGTDADGNQIIISSGTGGKVDVIVQGSESEQLAESFIYRDQSGKNDATDPVNDYVLGQRSISVELDYQQRRKLFFDSGILPYQPVNNIVSISGSLSGPNFVQKYTDDNGNIKGSFELLKDTGAFGGSAFGFDKIHFISNTIELEDEQQTKLQFNSQDTLDYTDVSKIESCRQVVQIVGEHPSIDPSDRSILTLKHTPVISVDRVVNLNTGERYRITNQNYDGEPGSENSTGRIQISGGTLPTANDILQVNYSWNYIYDRYSDFDNLEQDSFTRTVQDSIDWGFGNKIYAEETTVLYSVLDGYHAILTHPISRLVNVNTKTSESATVANNKIIVAQPITNILSVKNADGMEAYYTALSNGSFSGTEITLPTDTLLDGYETALVEYNYADIYSPDGYDYGSFSGNVVKFSNYSTAGTTIYVDYVANVSTLIPANALSLTPFVGSENNFVINNAVVGDQPVSNVWTNSTTFTRNLRFSPTYLRMNFQGLTTSGRLAIKGTTVSKIETVFTVTKDGLTLNLQDQIRAFLGSAIPSSLFVSKLEKLEKVTLTNGLVSNVDFTYDILNYKLNTAKFSNGKAFVDSSLDRTEVSLQDTQSNLDSAPSTGDTLRIVFYVADENSVERMVVANNGIQISKYKYIYVEKIYIESGFTGLSGNIDGTISVFPYTQPLTSSQYFSTYSYVGPKEGERLTITYTFDRLISDLINVIEPVRPITADVLVKSAVAVELDVSVSVVASSSYTGTNTNLQQAVSDNITSFLNSNGLNTTLDYSDIIDNLYNVSGVDRVIITKFNKTGLSGVKKSIAAQKTEYLTAGIISVTIEER